MAYNLFTSPALGASKQNTQAAQVKQEAALRKVPGMNPILDWAQQPQVSQQLNDIAAGKQVVQQPAQNFVPTQKYRPVPKIDPNSATSGMDAVTQMYTSPEEEERLRKASSNKQKMLAIADAFRHIGNIYHTNKYAPAQKFNQPWAEELTRYERGKAVRDAANARYYAYQQQKAAQDAKQKQWEAEYGLKMADAARKAGLSEAQIQNWKDRLKADTDYKNAEHARKKAADKARNDFNEKKFAFDKTHKARMAGIAAGNLAVRREALEHKKKTGGRGGSGVAPLDTPYGMIYPSGKSYGNQLSQIWDYAKEKGLVGDSDITAVMKATGMMGDTKDSRKRSQAIELLRRNPQLAEYAESRLGWTRGEYNPIALATPRTPSNYVASGNSWAHPGLPGYNPTDHDWDEYSDDEEDDWDEYIMD